MIGFICWATIGGKKTRKFIGKNATVILCTGGACDVWYLVKALNECGLMEEFHWRESEMERV